VAYLEMKGITKRFPGVIANNKISFSVEKGHIHALVGENGAGKSTLMRILYGLYKADEGEIIFDGQPAVINSPRDAIQLGIGMVHQEFQLVPSLTVAENIVLGYEPRRNIWVDRDQARQQVIDLSEKYGLLVDPDAVVREVPVGVQQRVEILKLLYRQAELLILDEPTAVLTPQEVQGLFEIIKRLTSQGHTIILITHKLIEVMNLCDHATVLRRGEKVGSVLVAESSEAEIARMMVGREIVRSYEKKHKAGLSPKLVCKNLSAVNDRWLPALRQINFTVNAGEIVGIAGVEGNGQSELVEVLAGLRECEGEITLNGEDLTGQNNRSRREIGVAIVPENRKTQGLNLLGPVTENLVVNRYYKPPFTIRGILSLRNMTQYARDLIKRFDIRAEGPNAVVGTLSGGNAQKIIIARELATQPDVLVAAHPTRGLDIAATQYVHQELLSIREENLGVLLISADLDELLAISDRILVLFEGQIVGEVDPKTVTFEQLGLLMAGHIKNVPQAVEE